MLRAASRKVGHSEADPSPRSGQSTGIPFRSASQCGPSPSSNCRVSLRAARASLAQMVDWPERLNTEMDAPSTGRSSTKGLHNVPRSKAPGKMIPGGAGSVAIEDFHETLCGYANPGNFGRVQTMLGPSCGNHTPSQWESDRQCRRSCLRATIGRQSFSQISEISNAIAASAITPNAIQSPRLDHGPLLCSPMMSLRRATRMMR